MTLVGQWQSTEDFFTEFERDQDGRGRMSAINLSLLRRARPRWSNQLSCIPVMGICMGFKSAARDASDWVRVEPRPDHSSGPLVAVTLHRSEHSGPPARHGEQVIGATICRELTAPTVLESFLLQIGDEQLADSTCPFWTAPRATPPADSGRSSRSLTPETGT